MENSEIIQSVCNIWNKFDLFWKWVLLQNLLKLTYFDKKKSIICLQSRFFYTFLI